GPRIDEAWCLCFAEWVSRRRCVARKWEEATARSHLPTTPARRARRDARSRACIRRAARRGAGQRRPRARRAGEVSPPIAALCLRRSLRRVRSEVAEHVAQRRHGFPNRARAGGCELRTSPRSAALPWLRRDNGEADE